MNTNSLHHVSGKGVANLPLPFSLKAARFIFGFSVFLIFFFGSLLLFGWNWIEDDFSALNAFKASLLTTFAFVLSRLILRQPWMDAAFRLRREESSLRFKGFFSFQDALRFWLSIASLFLLSCFLFLKWLGSVPLPQKIEKMSFQPLIQNAASLPVFFWDYSMMIPPQFLLENELILPYEKGPPQKYFSKIYFRSKKKELLLELGGKRPRTYSHSEVVSLFERLHGENPRFHPKAYSLTYRLNKESGLSNATENSVLSLATTNLGYSLIGKLWFSNPEQDSRFILMSTEGAIYPIRCFEPCHEEAILSSLQITADSKGSFTERKKFVTVQLNRIFAKLAKAPPADKPLLEAQLQLYLISLLTMDPRSAESLFHLGKLTQNSDTLEAILKYARDLRMDASQIAELQGRSSQLTH